MRLTVENLEDVLDAAHQARGAGSHKAAAATTSALQHGADGLRFLKQMTSAKKDLLSHDIRRRQPVRLDSKKGACLDDGNQQRAEADRAERGGGCALERLPGRVLGHSMSRQEVPGKKSQHDCRHSGNQI